MCAFLSHINLDKWALGSHHEVPGAAGALSSALWLGGPSLSSLLIDKVQSVSAPTQRTVFALLPHFCSIFTLFLFFKSKRAAALTFTV